MCKASCHQVSILVSSCTSLSWTTHIFPCFTLRVCSSSIILAESSLCCKRWLLSLAWRAATAGYGRYAARRLQWQSRDVLSLLSVQLNTDDGQNATKMLQQSSIGGCTCCKEGFNESFLCQPAITLSEYSRG